PSQRQHQSLRQSERFGAMQRYGLGYRRRLTRASATMTPPQLAPGLGSKQALRKLSARGRVGCGAHVPLAVLGEVVERVQDSSTTSWPDHPIPAIKTILARSCEAGCWLHRVVRS